jgi:hypothetical protein
MVNIDGSLLIQLNTLMKPFLLVIRHLMNLSLAWFDPICPQYCIIADQSSELLECDLCGESEMSMSGVEKNNGNVILGVP